MNDPVSEELRELTNTQKDIFGEVDELILSIEDRVTDPLVEMLQREIEEKNLWLANLNKELCEANECIVGYKKLGEAWKDNEKILTQQANSARDEVRRLKVNASADLEEIKILKCLVAEYVAKMRMLIDMFDQLCLAESALIPADTVVQYPPCTAAFICCDDDGMGPRNQLNFEKIQRAFPNVDFIGGQPVFVSSRCLDRPNVPVVDLVILFTAGLSHTDGDAIRNNVRRQNPQAHVLTQINSISLLIVNLTKWLSNPGFARVSVY